ncbi:hypothetical protein ABE504_23510 [Paenibacillus oryzisoli]|uniref:hypothetical protein n=1 Tax=Paenibacillus oryzisoli TaxID=1850517 RepID=UPI003D268173
MRQRLAQHPDANQESTVRAASLQICRNSPPSSLFNENACKKAGVCGKNPLFEQFRPKKLLYRRFFAENAIFAKNTCRFAGISLS